MSNDKGVEDSPFGCFHDGGWLFHKEDIIGYTFQTKEIFL